MSSNQSNKNGQLQRRTRRTRRPRRETIVLNERAPRASKRNQNRNRNNKQRMHGAGKSSIGSTLGGLLGGAAEKLFRTVTGLGTYEEVMDPEAKTEGAEVPYDIDSNVLLDSAQQHPQLVSPHSAISQNHTIWSPQIPFISGPQHDGVVIRHREYISDLRMTDSFSNVALTINPTNFLLFPWLSGIATRFEQYHFAGLVFEFRSLSANALSGTQASMGSVTFATQYDVDTLAYNSKTSANNSTYATSCKPAENMVHPIECAPDQTSVSLLYTFANDSSSAFTRDRRLERLGRINFITQGAQNPYPSAGEVWVTYEVHLHKPFSPTPLVPPPPAEIERYRTVVTSETKEDQPARTLGFPSELGDKATNAKPQGNPVHLDPYVKVDNPTDAPMPAKQTHLVYH